MPPPSKPPPVSAASRLRAGLALDLRSLALVRAGLGGVLLIDALARLPDAGRLYSDHGLLPRDLALALIDPAQWSLHLASGSLSLALLLTLAQALAAGALLIGWHTRSATLLAWTLAVSAMVRNPLLASAAEGYASALLLWGLVLPWQSRWSLDAALAHDPPATDDPHQHPHQHFSVSGIALRLQVLLVPLVAVAQPGLGAWTTQLAALTDIPPGLARIGGLLLLAIPLLALLPLARPWPQRLALAIHTMLCLLTALLFEAGALPWVALFAGAVLIDRGMWDRLAAVDGAELRLYYAPDAMPQQRLARLLRELLALPACQVLPASASARAERLLQGPRRLVLMDRQDAAHFDAGAVSVLLLESPLLRPWRRWLRGPGPGARVHGGLLWALGRSSPRQPTASQPADFSTGPLPQALAGLLALILLGHVAFAVLTPTAVSPPLPLRLLALDRSLLALPAAAGTRGWLVVPGEQADQAEVDVLARPDRSPDQTPEQTPEQPPDYGRAGREPLGDGLRGNLMRQALFDPRPARAGAAQAGLAAWLCRRANQGLPPDAPQRLLRLRLVQVSGDPAAPAQLEQRVLLRHDCAPAGRPGA